MEVSLFPRVIRIEPSSACNLSCRHCPTGTVELDRGVMKGSLFRRVLQSIEPFKAHVKTVVLYHGGEPFLNKRFLSMHLSVKALGIPFIKTVSNGMLLSNDLIEGIVAQELDAIEFSLDGESALENNYVRRRGEFSTVVDHIKKLLDHKRREGKDKPQVVVSQTRFLISGEFPRDNPAPQGELLEAFADYLDQITFQATWAMRWPHMRVDDRIFSLFKDTTHADRTYCDHLYHTLTIASNGDILPCCYDLTRQMVLGNIYHKTLADIWRGRTLNRLRAAIDKGAYPVLCQRCNTVSTPVYLIKRGASFPLRLVT
ncbi:radical SAM/SPASM domain-containing protein [Magnetococcales bacterium HHB-1]